MNNEKPLLILMSKVAFLLQYGYWINSAEELLYISLDFSLLTILDVDSWNSCADGAE